MKQNLTEIVCVLDKSGSMFPVANDVIGGYNRFIEEQKAFPGEAKVTLVLFDTAYEIIYHGWSIEKVPVLNNTVYTASGCTALLDAVGKAINEVGQRLHKTPESERPSKVIVLIMTDGEENSSQEYSKKQIQEMIKHQQDVYKWEFLFIGANQDSFDEAGSLSIPIHNIANYTATTAGVNVAWNTLNSRTLGYRKI